MNETTVFVGSKSFFLAALKRLREVEGAGLTTAITLDDSHDLRCVYTDIRHYARDSGMPLHVAKSRAHMPEFLAGLSPTRVLICGWYWLIDEGALSLAPKEFVDIHNSLLPHYRGGAPLVWALINGETRVGSSIFEFGKGMDEGDIFHQVALDVGTDESIGDVLPRLESSILDALPSVWRTIVAGNAQRRAQDHAQATYCGQRRPEDGRVEWRMPARRVHDFIRAQSPPYPGAFAMMSGQKVVCLRSRPLDRPYLGTPGQVLVVRPSGVIVACGDNRAVEILECECECEGVIGPASQFLNSIHIRL
jgi:methionyl-tRNA formyltransferase